MIALNSFATVRFLLQRLKSDNSKSDLYEKKCDSVVSLFETWLSAYDKDAIDKLECVIKNEIRQLNEALSPSAIYPAAETETNNGSAEIDTSPAAAAATDAECDLLSPPTGNPSSDISSSHKK